MTCVDLVVDCRLRAATDLLAHQWDPLVLAALRPGPRRRGELRAAIGPISDKVLTETLRRVLANGLVERTGSHNRADYALTALGVSLVEGPLAALGAWIKSHGEELLEAQEAVGRFSGERAG
jgi:DNA-binding HxlR family transcriptional regulator